MEGRSFGEGVKRVVRKEDLEGVGGGASSCIARGSGGSVVFIMVKELDGFMKASRV